VSKLALDPVNVPALSAAPSTPTIRTGDVYFDTVQNTLFVYNGSSWVQLTSSSTSVAAIDGGISDSIAPYTGGRSTTTATQTVNGGSA